MRILLSICQKAKNKMGAEITCFTVVVTYYTYTDHDEPVTHEVSELFYESHIIKRVELSSAVQ